MSLSPTTNDANHAGVLGECNYHITIYIAAVTNIETPLPASSGQDVFALLGLADGIAAAQTRANAYLTGVAAPLRVLARAQIPACNSGFQTFAQQANAFTSGQPLDATRKAALLSVLQTFSTNVHALQTNLTAIHRNFSAFQQGVPADAQTMQQLQIDIAPDGTVASSAGLSGADRQMVQQTIELSAPNLSQDAGLAVTESGAMALSLSELADTFTTMDSKVATFLQDFSDTGESALAGQLDPLSLQAAEADWQQFAAYVAQIGF